MKIVKLLGGVFVVTLVAYGLLYWSSHNSTSPYSVLPKLHPSDVAPSEAKPKTGDALLIEADEKILATAEIKPDVKNTTPVVTTPQKKSTPTKPKIASTRLPLPKPRAMHYRVLLGSFPVADLYLSLEELDPTSLELRTVMRSKGIADIAGGYKNNVVSSITATPEGYAPYSYDVQFKLKGEWRTIHLGYNEKGAIDSESNTPPEKRWKRKEVPVEQKNHTFDPLMLGLMAREEIGKLLKNSKNVKGKTFTLPLYDGRRRADITFTLDGLNKQNMLALHFSETPVAGYTDNELKSLNKEKPVVHLEIDPEYVLPVRAEGESSLGKASIELTQTCNTLEECM